MDGKALLRIGLMLAAAVSIMGLSSAALHAQQNPPRVRIAKANKRVDGHSPAKLRDKKSQLGALLFFDARLSGDAKVRCASCHAPAKMWTDGQAMSDGYPGALYFRNTPTLLNVSKRRFVYWDGRLSGADLPTLVRDHIAEAHFMNADGRLVVERLRQVPEYDAAFHDAFGGEVNYGRVLKAIAAFLAELNSAESPYDRYLAGEADALSPAADQGRELFFGKADCARCHHGPLLTDEQFHHLGLAANTAVFREPERHITFRRFLRTSGVPRYAQLRSDPGRFAVTKEPDDFGRFRTPSLREVAFTAPYMHDGSLPTLEKVVEFYNRGGGDGPHKDAALQPLGLSAGEQTALVEFLKSLSSEAPSIAAIEPPPYELRPLGAN